MERKSNKKVNKAKKFTKIIYFDENSVTDYIQIIEGGRLTKTTELLDENNNQGNADLDAEASIGISRLFKSLIGFGAKVQTESKLETSYRDEKLVKTILQNTILTDFLDIVNDDNTSVKMFDDIKIKIIKDSLSYIIMVSPYMKMLKGKGLDIDTGLDLSIDILKMDESIRLAKGYFEFEGIVDEKSVILRFNIDSFKNNYKISDLLKMDLTIYAVPVGRVDKSSISIVSEIDAVTTVEKTVVCDNPKYGDTNIEQEDNKSDILTVYDVLLAGVAQNEQ